MLYTYSNRRSSISPLFLVVPVVIVVVIGAFQMFRGVPAVQSTTVLPASTVVGTAAQVSMPSVGSATVSVVGLGTVASSGAAVPRPIASVTKMMTAYVILKGHPLQLGEAGPSVTITARDASRYLQMIAEDQSALPVSPGTALTQYELLQGLLVPSANNFGEILANWDAGSVAAFVEKMNAEAGSLGMTNTTYTDVSGFSAGSVSTPQDQLILARAVMQNPVFAAIVGMEEVRLPGIGAASNVNQLLGQDGIIGIKTGFTEEAGGNLAFAARRQVGAQQVDVVGVVLGQVNRPAAFDATRRILASLNQGLQSARLITAGQEVATLRSDWSDEIPVVAAQDVQAVLWPGMTMQTVVELDPLDSPLEAGSQVGWLILRLGEQEHRVPLQLAEDLPKAGLFWKLTRF